MSPKVWADTSLKAAPNEIVAAYRDYLRFTKYVNYLINTNAVVAAAPFSTDDAQLREHGLLWWLLLILVEAERSDK